MIIKCSKCNAEHPEYFANCPKCNFDRLQSKNSSFLQSNAQEIEANSLNIFDFSFKVFTIKRLMKLFYGPIVTLGALFCIVGFIGISELKILTFYERLGLCFLALVWYLQSVIFLRIGCELCLLLFNIEKNTRK